MWQRIQTVFLGLAILSLAGSILFPILMGVTSDGGTYALYPLHLMHKFGAEAAKSKVYSYFPYCITAVFIVASLTVCVVEIRRYDNRMLQMKLSLLNSLLLIGAMVCAVVFIYQIKDQFEFVSLKNDFGLYLLFAATVFNWLALRFIKRDEKLVRDSDRLR